MLKTAEQVTFGHPDKVCDQISDAILDECLKQDKNSRTAIEVLGGHGKLYIVGEITSKAKFDAKEIVRKVYKEIGYENKLEIEVNLVLQSKDIARGVDTGGAGDQGIMVGYATSETEELLPLEHVLATRLIRQLEKVRIDNILTFIKPDGKAQITLKDNKVDTIVLSTQHNKNISLEELRKEIIDKVIKPIIPEYDNVYINPAGPFISGGFEADTGLTGRKIIADNYGPQIPVGGGAYSGKDSTKVDRSGAYMARYLAVEYLKKYNADKVLVKIAYAIGKKEPIMAIADIDGRKEVIKDYDLSPQGIINFLNLDKSQFRKRAHYGFFKDFTL